eukprot:TRINITY_DN107264_c0_g1_i1.p1 TRINITY_DN107264_c0_g1~~TRINITY_DN107264_c0_g1_i1.p1  ORF type:complete len:183 (-),score=42.86 TRINITY_DN107264_c0_g1_i1:28-576(-)
MKAFKLNIMDPRQWAPVLEYVARHGKFDFSVCTQTLEDLPQPGLAVEFLSRISKEGVVTTPTKYLEMQRGVQGPWRGFLHHRWVMTVKDGTLNGFPKVPVLEHEAQDFFDTLANITAVEDGLWNTLTVFWRGSLPFKENHEGKLYWAQGVAEHFIEGLSRDETDVAREKAERYLKPATASTP